MLVTEAGLLLTSGSLHSLAYWQAGCGWSNVVLGWQEGLMEADLLAMGSMEPSGGKWTGRIVDMGQENSNTHSLVSNTKMVKIKINECEV